MAGENSRLRSGRSRPLARPDQPGDGRTTITPVCVGARHRFAAPFAYRSHAAEGSLWPVLTRDNHWRLPVISGNYRGSGPRRLSRDNCRRARNSFRTASDERTRFWRANPSQTTRQTRFPSFIGERYLPAKPYRGSEPAGCAGDNCRRARNLFAERRTRFWRANPDNLEPFGAVGAQTRRSHLSLALASATVCHCMLETASGPPQASGSM
jgi:hypothetical protein